MPTTRKQQQTLNVEKTDEGVGKVEMKNGGEGGGAKGDAATAAAGDKRKQGDDGGDGSHTKKEAADVDEESSSARPYKAAKTEDANGDETNGKDATADDDASTNDKSEQADGDAFGAPVTAPSASAEKKVSGQDTSAAASAPWSMLERGHVYFFYRPKVQPAEKADDPEPSADSISSVQNFHMLLLPRASDSETAPAKPEQERPSDAESKSEQTGEKARRGGIGARLIRLGKKRMPEPKAALAQGDQPGGIGGDASETIWAVVSDVATDFEQLKDSFQRREYSTKTSGQRVVQGARLAGRGWYTLSASQSDPPSSREVRLSYVLSHPSSDDDFGDVHGELGLQRESSVRLQMRNPTLPSTDSAGAPPAGLEPSARAELSKDELEKTFGGAADEDGATRYARPEDVSLLDRAGVELLVIKKKEQENEGDAVGLGDTQQKAVEKLANDDAQRLSNDDVIRGELKLSAEENPPDALDGEWI